jgi:hypothetical protein
MVCRGAWTIMGFYFSRVLCLLVVAVGALASSGAHTPPKFKVLSEK